MAIENLITDHLDLWTAAVRPKSSAGRGSNSKLELTGIKKLRELILELAVRGKLVPQDPSDEPASVLRERISAEKVRLLNEGKIKKNKALLEIGEEDNPFALPDGWIWQSITDVFYPISVGSNKIKTAEILDVGAVPVVDQGKVFIAGYTDRVDLKITLPGPVIVFGDHTSALKYIDFDFVAGADGVKILRPICICERYFYLVCNTLPIESRGYGRHYNRLLDNKFPLPPMGEQYRIVAKVDELMALCDQLEQRSESQLAAHQMLVETLLATLTDSCDAEELAQNWARLSSHFDILFTTEASIDALKQSILQLAVMGKLVSQDPSDEPASALLERIAAEKAQLVKEKKIKKEKPLPAISEDEKPFELPLGWVWSRISESSLFCEYGSSEKTVSELSDGVPVLKMGDIQDGKVILGSHQVVSPKIDDLPNLYLKKGDILYNRTNSAELVGKTGMFDGDDDTYTFASYLIRIRCSIHNIRPEYLTLCMNSPLFRKTQIEPHIKQQCGQANVNGTLMKSMLVSIPPYHEQVLILQKIHELMTLCDQLKSRLQTSQQTQLALAESLVEGALA
ncbi:restriction endonuclease subunit S [Aeromonas veronii]|uniref:restriction endonuclease subunit S n=1 Tax=Aeromonas veronii TaxID=654 RepID=UPI00222FF1C7|nr:restriction endonuclease subunit S [Aeromonas veronii]UZE59689.1 restriction endonuclease subunit S [Aeromonas veronii]